jgi:AraC-like DNA-binding protein
VRKTVAEFAGGEVAEELLHDFHVRSSVLCRSLMGAPWGFGVASKQKGSFHMILDGAGWLEVEGDEAPVRLEEGDLVILPKGDAHWVRDAQGSAAPLLASILERHEVIDGELHFGSDEGPLTEIVCGVYTLDEPGPGPWLSRLPRWIRSGADDRTPEWHGVVAEALRDEARSPSQRAGAVVNRLLESLLVTTLSRALEESIDGSEPVVRSDRRLGSVLARLRESPDQPWTVERLAREAAMSRSAFSDRFRAVVGQAPIRYVTRIRLERSAAMLTRTDATIAEIARSVGYGSEESLSRAFKARFGIGPTAYRQAARAAATSG